MWSTSGFVARSCHGNAAEEDPSPLGRGLPLVEAHSEPLGDAEEEALPHPKVTRGGGSVDRKLPAIWSGWRGSHVCSGSPSPMIWWPSEMDGDASRKKVGPTV